MNQESQKSLVSSAPNTSCKAPADPPFTFGIEEEFFVTSLESRDLAVRSHPQFLADCRDALGGIVSVEMLQSQLEIATPVLSEIREARLELRQTRQRIARIAARHKLSIAASGTYPLALWSEQRLTEKRRYRAIGEALQIVGRRNVLCGMHVHVAPPENTSRIDLMNRSLPFLPLLLALSTSSPFWQKQRTGMAGYRLSAYDELPRTGLPAIFRNEGDYLSFVSKLVRSGAILDESQIWWAIRPSAKFPTLELRIADSCTFVEDTLCIASIFRCLIRALWRMPTLNSDISPMTRLIVDENRWRAQRFGVRGTHIDLTRDRLRPVSEILDDTLKLIEDDAIALRCYDEVQHARRIIERGTSAELQLETYQVARDAGCTRRSALLKVAEWIDVETRSISDESLPYKRPQYQ